MTWNLWTKLLNHWSQHLINKFHVRKFLWAYYEELSTFFTIFAPSLRSICCVCRKSCAALAMFFIFCTRNSPLNCVARPYWHILFMMIHDDWLIRKRQWFQWNASFPYITSPFDSKTTTYCCWCCACAVVVVWYVWFVWFENIMSKMCRMTRHHVQPSTTHRHSSNVSREPIDWLSTWKIQFVMYAYTACSFGAYTSHLRMHAAILCHGCSQVRKLKFQFKSNWCLFTHSLTKLIDGCAHTRIRTHTHTHKRIQQISMSNTKLIHVRQPSNQVIILSLLQVFCIANHLWNSLEFFAIPNSLMHSLSLKKINNGIFFTLPIVCSVNC